MYGYSIHWFLGLNGKTFNMKRFFFVRRGFNCNMCHKESLNVFKIIKCRLSYIKDFVCLVSSFTSQWYIFSFLRFLDFCPPWISRYFYNSIQDILMINKVSILRSKKCRIINKNEYIKITQAQILFPENYEFL